MKALLRFQAVVAARALTNRTFAYVAAMPLVILIAGLFAAGRSRDLSTPLALAVIVPTVAGMGATFGALDAVRWSAPIGRSRVLWAHFLFWATVCAPPITAVAAFAAHGSGEDRIAFFANAMLLALAAAAVVPVHQCWRRNVTFESAMRFIALTTVVFGLGSWSAFLAMRGRSAFALALGCAAFCVAMAVGCRTYFREERLPAASGADDPRDLQPARRTPRKPAASLRSAMPNRGLMIAYVVVALGLQFVQPASKDSVPSLLLLGAALGLGNASLSSCRWLFAGPMSRSRMFRRCCVPVILIVVAGVSARSLMQELRPDRSVFFDTFLPSGPRVHHQHALVLGQVLPLEDASNSTNGPAPVRVPGTQRVHGAPDVPYMAVRVREHLANEYGLDVSEARLESIILRGWPAHWGADENYWVNEQQEAVFDAMERVQAELDGEIVAADRRRIAVNACGVILLSLLLLRGQLHGVRRVWFTTSLWLVFCVALFAPQFAPQSRVTELVLRARHGVFDFVSGTPMLVTALGFVALALLLWKSCERAFRRLDVTDLPAATMAEWRQTRSA